MNATSIILWTLAHILVCILHPLSMDAMTETGAAASSCSLWPYTYDVLLSLKG